MKVISSARKMLERELHSLISERKKIDGDIYRLKKSIEAIEYAEQLQRIRRKSSPRSDKGKTKGPKAKKTAKERETQDKKSMNTQAIGKRPVTLIPGDPLRTGVANATT